MTNCFRRNGFPGITPATRGIGELPSRPRRSTPCWRRPTCCTGSRTSTRSCWPPRWPAIRTCAGCRPWPPAAVSVQAANLSEADLRRVTFTTSAGVHGGTLAEFALFGVLAGAKDLPRLQQLKAAREWPERWAMRQVGEQTVLVVGLGGIGKQTAKLLKGLGATVLGVKRSIEPVEYVDEVHPDSALPDLVGRADAIVFTLPGTDATAGLYNADLIRSTKPGAVIVNVGRGTVIDEPALIDGLTDGPLGSAFLDVTAVEPLPAESPLWTLPNVVIAPHTAALNDAEDRRIAELFARNLRAFLDDEPLVNVVDPAEFY